MKWFALILGLFLTSTGYAADDSCRHNPIYCKILKFKKNVDPKWAMDFSNKLSVKSKENGIDANVALAILMQESHLENLNTYKTSTEVQKHCDEKNCYQVTTTTEKAFDLTFAQINVNTAIDYKFDIERLFLFDEAYTLDCFFQILHDKINMCKGKDKPWACYHSVNDGPRTIYIELVSKYL